MKFFWSERRPGRKLALISRISFNTGKGLKEINQIKVKIKSLRIDWTPKYPRTYKIHFMVY